MAKTDRIFYHERRKSFQKNIDIKLKTDLKEEQINEKLLNYKCQNYNDLFKIQQIKPKKKYQYFHSLAARKRIK